MADEPPGQALRQNEELDNKQYGEHDEQQAAASFKKTFAVKVFLVDGSEAYRIVENAVHSNVVPGGRVGRMENVRKLQDDGDIEERYDRTGRIVVLRIFFVTGVADMELTNYSANDARNDVNEINVGAKYIVF